MQEFLDTCTVGQRWVVDKLKFRKIAKPQGRGHLISEPPRRPIQRLLSFCDLICIPNNAEIDLGTGRVPVHTDVCNSDFRQPWVIALLQKQHRDLPLDQLVHAALVFLTHVFLPQESTDETGLPKPGLVQSWIDHIV